jgi:hypothetical protein
MALNINGTTGISGVDGSASAPALKGADANTGVSFGTDIIDLNTGGSSRFKIGAAGQLGVAGANYGSSGQALVSQGASAAPQWATVGGGGKVLQVVPVNFNTSASTTSGSFVSTGLSANITLSANNYVLVRAHGGAANNSAGYGSYYTIYRGSSNIAPHGSYMGSHYGEDNSNNVVSTVYMEVRDTPGIGTHTYSVEHHVWGGGTSVFGKNTTGAIVLMEIAA